MTLTFLRNTGHFCFRCFYFFIQCPSKIRFFFNVFGLVTLWLWVLERKPTKVKCHFSHIIDSVNPITMVYLIWCWPWSLDWCSICQLCFATLSILNTLEGSHYAQPTLKKRKLCSLSLRAEYLPTVFRKLLNGRFFLFSLLYLFNHSFI